MVVIKWAEHMTKKNEKENVHLLIADSNQAPDFKLKSKAIVGIYIVAHSNLCIPRFET